LRPDEVLVDGRVQDAVSMLHLAVSVICCNAAIRSPRVVMT
jgi:hypothetical protein